VARLQRRSQHRATIFFQYFDREGRLVDEQTQSYLVTTRSNGTMFVRKQYENYPVLSEGGKLIAFGGQYEGATVDARQKWTR